MSRELSITHCPGWGLIGLFIIPNLPRTCIDSKSSVFMVYFIQMLTKIAQLLAVFLTFRTCLTKCESVNITDNDYSLLHSNKTLFLLVYVTTAD
jgi:hypothetical protein